MLRIYFSLAMQVAETLQATIAVTPQSAALECAGRLAQKIRVLSLYVESLADSLSNSTDATSGLESTTMTHKKDHYPPRRSLLGTTLETMSADKTALPHMEAQLGTRCNKKSNPKLKACDKDGDGGVNRTQGNCTLAICMAICQAHVGFKCRYLLRMVVYQW